MSTAPINANITKDETIFLNGCLRPSRFQIDFAASDPMATPAAAAIYSENESKKEMFTKPERKSVRISAIGSTISNNNVVRRIRRERSDGCVVEEDFGSKSNFFSNSVIGKLYAAELQLIGVLQMNGTGESLVEAGFVKLLRERR